MTIQISFDMCFEFFAYVATGIQGTPPKGGRVGFPLLVVCASVLLRSHGCIMVHLTWDPDRYDIISEHQLFLCTWSIWNHTDFAEVRVFAFLAAPDLRSLFAVCFCIHIDSEDILERLDESRRVEG